MNTPPLADSPVTLLTRQQAATALTLSLRSLDALTAEGKLAYVKVGRSVRLRPEDLQEFVMRFRVRPKASRPGMETAVA